MKTWTNSYRLEDESGELRRGIYTLEPAPQGYKAIEVSIAKAQTSKKDAQEWLAVQVYATKDNGDTVEKFNPQLEHIKTAKGVQFRVKANYRPLATAENVKKILKDVEDLIEVQTAKQ